VVHQSYTDYYSVAGTTFTDFHWWGAKNSGSAAVTGFDFEIWTNNGVTDQPDALVYSEFIAGNAGETFVESSANYPADVYSYSMDMAAAYTPAAAGNYWFSVVAHSDNNWYWAQGADVDFLTDWQHQSPPGGDWTHPIENVDFAFELTGNPAPVPEPGTLALFGFGLAAGATRLRRKFGKKS